MTETLFDLTFLPAAPFWALMILLPKWSWTHRIVSSPLIVLPIVAIYAVLVLCTMPLFFVHARTMLGDAATMACATMCFCGFCGALLERGSWLPIAGWLVCGSIGAVGGYLSRGILIGVAAPLVGVGLTWLVLACSSSAGAWRPSSSEPTSVRSWMRAAIGVSTLLGGAVAVWIKRGRLNTGHCLLGGLLDLGLGPGGAGVGHAAHGVHDGHGAAHSATCVFEYSLGR